jgi:hypothetical protein
MSIIIKQDRINLLIYKYLVESGLESKYPCNFEIGLKHSAFSLLHEADLENIAKENQNLSPRLLINYLEKALLFNQIEAHLYKVIIRILLKYRMSMSNAMNLLSYWLHIIAK